MRLLLLVLLIPSLAQAFPFVAGQPLTAAQLNLAFSNAQITSGSIDGASIGSVTPSTGAFTTLSASGAVSGAGVTSYFAAPPPIGATTPNTGAFTTLNATGAIAGIDAVSAKQAVMFDQLPIVGTTASLGGAALVAGACASVTTTVTGATTTMAVVTSPQTYPGDGADWQSYVSAANTVVTKVCAFVALTPTASLYNLRVIQ